MKIGLKYKDIFDDLVKLIKSEAFALVNRNDDSRKLDISVITDKYGTSKIISGNTEFELDESIDSFEQDFDTEITNDGAPWFGTFRGQIVNSNDAEWIELLNVIAEKLHNNFSLLEYTGRIDFKQNQKKQIDEIKKIYNKFYDDKDITIEVSNYKHNYEDIYYALLKLDIGSGVGSPQTVLCKVFFMKKNSSYIPIKSVNAESLNNTLISYIDSSTSIKTEKINIEVNDICNSIAELMEDDFSEYMLYNSSDDLELIDQMLENSMNNNIILKCESMKILSITHYRWEKVSYFVKWRNEIILEFIYDTDNKISVKCHCCGSMILESADVNILNDTYMKEFKKHLQINNCQSKNCKRKICATNLIIKTKGSKEVRVCKDCKYLDILYRDKSANPIITDLAVYDRNSKDLVYSSNTQTCISCNRSFVSLEDHNCEICRNAKKALVSDPKSMIFKESRRLYKNYSHILPLHIRLFNKNNRKYAFEDDDHLILVVNKKIYHFNKLDILEKGYLNKFYNK